MFIRILGASVPVTVCSGGHSCPAILELESGNFAVIGKDITEAALPKLPAGSGCGPFERVVELPRKTLLDARPDIVSL